MAIMRPSNYWTDKEKFKKIESPSKKLSPGKVSHMGPGSMGPPPKRGFSDNENMVPLRPGAPEVGGGMMQRPMPALPPFEIEKRLKKLEVKPVASTALVKKVGDQYEYDKDFIYVAYASALANLSGGAIPSQSDATDFQLTPYNTSGVLLAYRGYLLNKSIYQSGDPTDYIWESTSGEDGFTSSERYHTTSTGLQESLGNPTKPGTNITWTAINAGTAVPSTAVYVAERFTITTTDGAVTSEWKIKIVGKHIDDTVIKTGGITTDTIASNAITSTKVTADAITVDKIDLNGTLAVTAASGAIRWNKADGDDTTNAGLFMGNNSSGSPRFVIGSTNSFIYFNGATGVVSAVGVSESATVGNEETFYTSGTSIFTISPLLDEINIQLVGAGGGGNQNGTSDGGGAAGNGAATTIKVITNVGGTRATYTAAGGAGGDAAGIGGTFAAGEAGQSFSNPSGAHSSFAGTGGAGGAYNTNNAGGNGGTGAGGGGQGQAGGGTAAHGGSGGSAASFFTITLTTASSHFVSTDHLEITVAAPTPGRRNSYGSGGGTGGGGRARIKGELA